MTTPVIFKTTTYECGCVAFWKLDLGSLEPTPLNCPVHGAIKKRSRSDVMPPRKEEPWGYCDECGAGEPTELLHHGWCTSCRMGARQDAEEGE